jgi:hypothetical protein
MDNQNLPEISYPNKLRVALQSIRGWKQLSGIDKEYEPEIFMDEIGKLFLDYFQFHVQEATSIGKEFEEELTWAVRFIDVHYVYLTQFSLSSASSWKDVWPTACLTATNIEAFGMMFGEIVGELDAGRIWEYIEDRREIESLEPHQRPKNVPKYHWWWFTEYVPKGIWP